MYCSVVIFYCSLAVILKSAIVLIILINISVQTQLQLSHCIQFYAIAILPFCHFRGNCCIFAAE